MVSTWLSKPHEAFRSGFYENDEFDFSVRLALGYCASGAADAGEILTTIAHIPNGDFPAWFDGWSDIAGRLRTVAESASADGHRVSAASAFLRAATYYSLALGAVDGLKDQSVLLPTFRAHRECWDAFTDDSAYPFERVEIPYASDTLPGYFAAPDDSGAARPTLVLNNGSDGAISSLWSAAGLGALQRGYNVLFFDGPGQQSMLFEREVYFRPDWEAVLTPVVEFLRAREDVDADRLAVYGISQAGYWVPRALAFEHRFAAAIVDPGVVEVATSWTDHLPKSLLTLFEHGEAEKFDRDMRMGLRMSPGGARTWNFRARPYGTRGYYETIAEVTRYDLTDVAGRITTPILITDPEDEQFWPGQSRRLFDLLEGTKEIVPFTAAEGGNVHCEPMARLLTEQRMFDWLDGVLAGDAEVDDSMANG